MNTKTMRLPPRRVSTADKRIISSTVAYKPTETAVIDPSPPSPTVKYILKKTPPSPPTTTAIAEPAGSTHLLAGYLAHEFLHKGTVFGELWNPARAQAGQFPAQSIEPKKTKPSQNLESSDHKRRRYVEVANILRADGTHLPGVVNPSQLSRVLRL